MSKGPGVTRRGFLKSAALGGACTGGGLWRKAEASSTPLPKRFLQQGRPRRVSLRDVGIVWEGQPAYRDFPPSMYGLGEGCEYFGLRRAYYLYHGNNEAPLNKLRHLDQVICDISIWRYRKIVDAEGAIGWGIYHEKSPDVIRTEAEAVSRLSLQFPNLYGAMLDDILGAIRSQGYTRDTFSEIHSCLKSSNPNLRTCCTVYTHELRAEAWSPFADLIDVVFLWVWKSEDLFKLDEGVEQCRRLFPDKPIVMGCYLSDYTLKTAVPMDRLRYQWERIPTYLETGSITGFCILGAYLIDRHVEQAEWIRDFVSRH